MSAESRGVIHDIGYRTYDGPRRGNRPIALSLFVNGLRYAYGLGRSGKAKALPMTMLAFALIPALIIVAIVVTVSIDEFVNYSTYSNTMFVLVIIFVAAQAPVLFTRDLRSGSIVLYLARPLPPAMFALMRWASLATAIFIFLSIPVLVLYLGALGADLDFTVQSVDFLQALVGLVVLSVVLATVSGLMSAYTLRRGLAVGAIIVALLVTNGFVVAIKGVALSTNNDALGEWIGLLSPFTLFDGIQSGLLGGTSFYLLSPQGAGMVALYAVWMVLVVGGGLWLLTRRYHQQGNR